MFVFSSASAETSVNGVLAAVWYLTTGSIQLSGTLRGGSTIADSAGALYTDDGGQYKAYIQGGAGAVSQEVSFNFTPSSSKYIRKVFNTNPTLTNSSITDTDEIETYWLGQTCEGHLANVVGSTTNTFGTVLGLDSGSADAANFETGFQAAQTPWIISQDTGARVNYQAENMTKLFRFHTLDAGEDEQKKLKISIADIKAPTSPDQKYGTFSVRTVTPITTLDEQSEISILLGMTPNAVTVFMETT